MAAATEEEAAATFKKETGDDDIAIANAAASRRVCVLCVSERMHAPMSPCRRLLLCETRSSLFRGLPYMTSANFSDFFYPPVTVTNQLILFLLSAFWGPPPPIHCGRHIWKPPYTASFGACSRQGRRLYSARETRLLVMAVLIGAFLSD